MESVRVDEVAEQELGSNHDDFYAHVFVPVGNAQDHARELVAEPLRVAIEIMLFCNCGGVYIRIAHPPAHGPMDSSAKRNYDTYHIQPAIAWLQMASPP